MKLTATQVGTAKELLGAFGATLVGCDPLADHRFNLSFQIGLTIVATTRARHQQTYFIIGIVFNVLGLQNIALTADIAHIQCQTTHIRIQGL
jgi:hypothetical protein